MPIEEAIENSKVSHGVNMYLISLLRLLHPMYAKFHQYMMIYIELSQYIYFCGIVQ